MHAASLFSHRRMWGKMQSDARHPSVVTMTQWPSTMPVSLFSV